MATLDRLAVGVGGNWLRVPLGAAISVS